MSVKKEDLWDYRFAKKRKIRVDIVKMITIVLIHQK